MSEKLYIFLCFFCAVFTDVIFSTFFGIITPFTALLVFYFTVVKGPVLSGVYAFVSGVMIDILLYREFLLTPVAFIIIVIIVDRLRKKAEMRQHLRLHLLPGGVAGFIYILVQYICGISSFSSTTVPLAFIKLGITAVSCILMGAILLPVCILSLDYIAEFFAYDEYLNL